MEKVLRWAADHWGSIVAVFLVFVQITPVKWNPLSSIAKWLGNLLFGDMRKRMEKLQTTLDNHIREDEDGKARNQRYRILRFYDEMCDKRKHSESHFEDILDDIDEYERYCEAHPQFKNNRGKAAMDYITSTYPKIKSNGGFLSHDQEHERARDE